MNVGAFAILDALGFKEASKMHDDEEIFDTYKSAIRISSIAQRTSNRYGVSGLPEGIRTKTSVRLFSDTIFVACWAKPASKELSGPSIRSLIEEVAMVANLVTDSFLNDKVPLAFRGALSYGRFRCEKDFVCGEAVNDAAEHHSLAEGALTWLTPKAKRIWDDSGINETFDSSSPIVPYTVPLKGGTTFRTLVINPRIYATSDPKVLMATFDHDSISVAIKRANTEAFLKYIKSLGGS